MRILLPVDGSPFSRLATDFVCGRLSSMPDRHLVDLMYVQPPLPLVARRAVSAKTRSLLYSTAGAKVMEPLARALNDVGARVRMRGEVGVPAPRIASRAHAIGADLIVMGSHGRTALRALVLGSVTQAVLALTSTPLLILRGKSVGARRRLRVGVAVDGSRASKAALATVLAHELLLGRLAALSLIHVQPPPQVFMDPLLGIAIPAVPGPDPAAVEAIMAPMRKMVLRAGLSGDEVVLTGRPDEELPAYAKKNLDLLALGATGRSRLSRVFLGSVTARIAARCEVPLLVVHAPA